MNVFAYLRHHARGDIAAALADPAGESLSMNSADQVRASNSSTDTSGAALADVGPAHGSSDAYAPELSAFDGTPAAQENVLRKCLDASFDHADPRVRGAALMILDRAGRLGAFDTLVKLLSRKLTERFSLANDPESGAAQSTARRWLELLRSHLGVIDLRRRRDQADSARFRAYAGGDADAIQSERAVAASFLSDPRPARRCAALMALRRNSDVTEQVTLKIFTMATADSDIDVREEAVRAIVAMSRSTRRSDVKQLLAKIVQNESECGRLRARAYQGLFFVDAKPYSEWPIVKAGRADLDALPDDTDIRYVKDCAEGESD